MYDKGQATVMPNGAEGEARLAFSYNACRKVFRIGIVRLL